MTLRFLMCVCAWGTTWGATPVTKNKAYISPHSAYLLISSISTCVTPHHIWLPLRWASNSALGSNVAAYCGFTSRPCNLCGDLGATCGSQHRSKQSDEDVPSLGESKLVWCMLWNRRPSTTVARHRDGPNAGVRITSCYTTTTTRFTQVASRQVYNTVRHTSCLRLSNYNKWPMVLSCIVLMWVFVFVFVCLFECLFVCRQNRIENVTTALPYIVKEFPTNVVKVLE